MDSEYKILIECKAILKEHGFNVDRGIVDTVEELARTVANIEKALYTVYSSELGAGTPLDELVDDLCEREGRKGQQMTCSVDSHPPLV